jgi:hypothetical protein
LAYGVGYFRSHTRDGFSLEAGDIELLDNFFPGAANVALLIKPYATKVSVGGFFVREYGVFPETTPLEFPMHRRELLGDESPSRRPLMESGPERRIDRRIERPPPAALAPEEMAPAEPSVVPATPAFAEQPSRGWRTGWVWFPLTFLFLLLGVALGYQLALTLGTRTSTAQDFSLSLSVKKTGDNLSVTWNRVSPVIRSAQKGLLEIDDGGYTKPVVLDAAQLQNGSLIYRNASKSVRFRLTVYPQARVGVVETLEWKQ